MKHIQQWLVVLGLALCCQHTLAFSLFDGVDFNLFGDDEDDEVVIWQSGPNQYFKLAPQADRNFGDSDHPVDINKSVIEVGLGLIKLKGSNADSFKSLRPVFDDQQIRAMATYIAQGLKSATAKQDIIFVMEKSKQKLLGLKTDSYFVAGRAFYKDGHLNIIMGDYQRERNRGYEAAYDPTNAGIVNYSFVHGSRSGKPESSFPFERSIENLPGVENKVLNGNIRRDWFVVDLTASAEAYAHREEMERQQELSRKRKELEEIFGQSLPQIANGNRAAPKMSPEERLTTLNELKTKGLVTEEEYETKRKQILEEL
jgi:hypothetical protein